MPNNKTIIRLLLFFTILTISTHFLHANTSIITISKIKIIINQNQVIWQDKTNIPNPANVGIKTSTVASYLGFAPGDRISPAQLKEKCKLAQWYLNDSGYFYDARVSIIPPRRKPESRTIIVNVREGFLYRFGGGSIYGMFGQVGLEGHRCSYKLRAGINWNEFIYRDELLFGVPLEFTGQITYKNSFANGYGFAFFHSAILKTSLDYRVIPGLKAGLGLSGEYLSLEWNTTNLDIGYPSQQWALILNPHIEWIANVFLGAIHLAFETTISANEYIPLSGGNAVFSTKAGWIGRIKFSQGHGIHIRIAGSIADRPLPYASKVNLYRTSDEMMRSDYTESELIGETCLNAGIEYRFPMLKFFIPPFFNTRVTGFCYLDVAKVSAYSKDITQRPLKTGIGLGIRLNFDNPVFTYFSFSYGWNDKGNGYFGFICSSGF